MRPVPGITFEKYGIQVSLDGELYSNGRLVSVLEVSKLCQLDLDIHELVAIAWCHDGETVWANSRYAYHIRRCVRQLKEDN